MGTTNRTTAQIQGTSFLLDLALGGELQDEARSEIIARAKKQRT